MTHVIGKITTRGKLPPADIKDEAARHMATVNECCIPPERVICFSDFVTGVYLPWVKEGKKPSTHKGYSDIWEHHLKGVSGNERGNLKDIRTFTVQRWRNQIGQGELSRNSLKRIQSVLSGIFKQAKRLGYYDGVNPVQDTAVSSHAAPPSETYAYSLEEIQSILGVLPEPAATCFAVASFAGLREGELSGLEWPDYRMERCTWRVLSGTVRSSSPRPSNQRYPSQ